jgi:membrane-bound ClpP family serine protease
VVTIVTVALRTRRLPPLNTGVMGKGTSLPPGTRGEVRTALAPLGTVYAAGEFWTARSASGLPLEQGTPVQVVSQEGLLLVVEPFTAPFAPPPPWATQPPPNQPPATI